MISEDLAAAVLCFEIWSIIGTVTVSDSIVSPWSWELTSGENPTYPMTNRNHAYYNWWLGRISLNFLI